MSLKQKLKRELKAVGLAMLYFFCWIAALMLMKRLVLAEYQIEFHGLTLALMGGLILAKVVLVLEHVSLGDWIRPRPAWVEVVLRTVMYSVGVLIVLLLEKGFEGRHEQGGFGASLKNLAHHADMNHVWANTICLTGALLVYNAMSVVRRHLGEKGRIGLFLLPVPEESNANQPEPAAPFELKRK